MVGTPADMSKAEELFKKLDQNSDGSISQEEFITIIKQDQDLLNVLQNTAWKLEKIMVELINFWYQKLAYCLWNLQKITKCNQLIIG